MTKIEFSMNFTGFIAILNSKGKKNFQKSCSLNKILYRQIGTCVNAQTFLILFG